MAAPPPIYAWSNNVSDVYHVGDRVVARGLEKADERKYNDTWGTVRHYVQNKDVYVKYKFSDAYMVRMDIDDVDKILHVDNITIRREVDLRFQPPARGGLEIALMDQDVALQLEMERIRKIEADKAKAKFKKEQAEKAAADEKKCDDA